MELLEWISLDDVEKRNFRGRTWIPLLSTQTHVLKLEFGKAGYRKDQEFIESLIIFQSDRPNCEQLSWEGVNKSGTDRAWTDKKTFRRPGDFYDFDDKVVGLRPVLKKGFDTGESTEWHLSQEIEFSLGLLRRGDIWVVPEEDYIEAVRLIRDLKGRPDLLEIRAEHLRDYLCARKAALLITGFRFRDAIEETLEEIPWQSDQERKFENGEWDGAKRQILEGGLPVGAQTAVLHVWRESVDPTDDVPIMPHPTNDPGAKSSEKIIQHKGRKLEFACGRIWWKQWIEPAGSSPRVGRDEVPSRVHFIVENQSGGTLSGNDLEEYRGWLWFNPAVIPALLQHEGGYLEWHTLATGSVGPASNRKIHFGMNPLGLVNTLGYKIAELPEWAQRIWAGHNIAPEGGLSYELHLSQNNAAPARTFAPEFTLWKNLEVIQQFAQLKFGSPFFTELPLESEYFRTIHRFYEESFRDVCRLAKEMMKIVAERINVDFVNVMLGSKLTETKKELRAIKRLETWLNGLGEDGHKIIGPLAGINDLRQGDAHAGESTAKAALEIFGIPDEAKEFQRMNLCIIGSVSWTMGVIAKTLDEKGALS